jgi:predicted NUDIX family NTP pyrophosphohydrolase
LEVLLVHPGGPIWKGRDEGVWSIPKGEPGPGEELLDAARREFEEETGFKAEGAPIELGTVRQKSGKIVHVWAMAGDCDASLASSNSFEMEWPPRSGKKASFPEIDRAEWMGLDQASRKINEAQRTFLDRLAGTLEEP